MDSESTDSYLGMSIADFEDEDITQATPSWNKFLDVDIFNDYDHDQPRSISSEIDTINVYYAGFFTVKISIQINGENIYQDRLNFFDKLALKS